MKSTRFRLVRIRIGQIASRDPQLRTLQLKHWLPSCPGTRFRSNIKSISLGSRLVNSRHSIKAGRMNITRLSQAQHDVYLIIEGNFERNQANDCIPHCGKGYGCQRVVEGVFLPIEELLEQLQGSGEGSIGHDEDHPCEGNQFHQSGLMTLYLQQQAFSLYCNMNSSRQLFVRAQLKHNLKLIQDDRSLRLDNQQFREMITSIYGGSLLQGQSYRICMRLNRCHIVAIYEHLQLQSPLVDILPVNDHQVQLVPLPFICPCHAIDAKVKVAFLGDKGSN